MIDWSNASVAAVVSAVMSALVTALVLLVTISVNSNKNKYKLGVLKRKPQMVTSKFVDSSANFRILVNGVDVEQVYLYNVKLCNVGYEALDDINCTFEASFGYHIIDFKMNTDSNDGRIDFEIFKQEDYKFKINFAYLNPKEAVEFRILSDAPPENMEIDLRNKGINLVDFIEVPEPFLYRMVRSASKKSKPQISVE